MVCHGSVPIPSGPAGRTEHSLILNLTANKLSTSVHYVPSVTKLIESSIKANVRNENRKAPMKCTLHTPSSSNWIPLHSRFCLLLGFQSCHQNYVHGFSWFPHQLASITRIRHLPFQSSLAANFKIFLDSVLYGHFPLYTLEF